MPRIDLARRNSSQSQTGSDLLKRASISSQRPLVASALSRTRGAFGGVAGLSAVTNLLMLTGPLFMMQVYDRVLTSRSVPTLVALSALVAGIYLFLGLLEIIRAKVLRRIASQVDEDLSDVSFRAVLDLPLRTGGSFRPLDDLDKIRGFMAGPGPIAICDLPWLPFYMVVIFAFHPVLGWLSLAGAGVLVAITLTSEFVLRAPMGRMAQLASARSALIESGRRNADTIRAMGMGGAYGLRWQTANGAYLSEVNRSGDLGGGFSAGTKIFRLALQSAILAIGAYLAIKGELSPGSMIAASILTSRALSPIEQAIGNWRGFVAARQSRTRLQTLLERLRDERQPMPLPAPQRVLDVKGLTIVVPETQTTLIRDVAFRLEAGQGLGIIGSSGSGKSTLARALVGIWPPAAGTIRLDGAELDNWRPEALGPYVGYLPQEVDLFDGTIAENIARFQPDAQPAAIIAAAQTAGVHDLVLSLPEGYDTKVGLSGATLSAGQRQRVGLARALYGEPFLVVLDEPNSNLDAEGEAALTGAVAKAREAGAAVIVIAHRPNVLAALDHVLVMANGRQTAFGPREDVLQKTTMRAVARSA